jgi:hypothetical protein
VRCEFPGFFRNFLRSRYLHRDIDSCPSTSFQPTIIQREEFPFPFKDANGSDIMWTDASTRESICQTIDRGSIAKCCLHACLAESYALGISQLYAQLSFLNHPI